MPEGDTLYRTARTLHKALQGKRVTNFETGVALLARVNDNQPIAGRMVERVEQRGKWCLMFFSGDLILASHMLMNGSWHLYRAGEKWWIARDRMRVAITCGEFQAVLFDAQIAEFLTPKELERHRQIARLGPEVLSGEFTVTRGVEALQRYAREHPEAEVGATLLNQRVLAGLGNVYKSEVAFAVGVNPFRRMSTLSLREMEKMIDVAQRYMQANVVEGSGEGIVTYTGPRRTTRNMDRGDRLWVYGREGKECRRCGAVVQMSKQGSQVRSTYWCPECQPWVAAEGQSEAAPVGRRSAMPIVPRKMGW